MQFFQPRHRTVPSETVREGERMKTERKSDAAFFSSIVSCKGRYLLSPTIARGIDQHAVFPATLLHRPFGDGARKRIRCGDGGRRRKSEEGAKN
ncbi:MAG: hypothetical protein EBR30_17830 [Cytophagia bacterium]|nr:hypothetical protein [Cytophagia bacterium]